MKEKKEILRTLAQSDEDRLLVAQALDKLALCQGKEYPTNTRFLDPRERALVTEAITMADGLQQMVLYGGYAEAERAIAIFFPPCMDAASAILPENVPLTLIRAQKHPQDTLLHRDYLGAMMGLQITRGSIGDILVCPDGADIVVLQDIAAFLLLHFDKAGKRSLRLSEAPLCSIRAVPEETDTYTANTATMRLDSVIAAIFHLSRTEAQAYIIHGQVSLNFLSSEKADRLVCVEDRITVRGKGRARIISLEGQSRKGRQFFRYTRSK